MSWSTVLLGTIGETVPSRRPVQRPARLLVPRPGGPKARQASRTRVTVRRSDVHLVGDHARRLHADSRPEPRRDEARPEPQRSDAPQSTAADSSSQSRLESLLSLGPDLFDPSRKPRHPIVLAHGLYGFSYRGLDAFPRFQVHYWSQVLQILRHKLGCEVIVGKVPGTGTIKERAEALHKLLEADERVRGKEVNLLAHSMGGLDARYLITHIRPTSYRPVSLTTLSTPHRGSPFMAWCQANIGVGSALRHDLGAAFAESSGSSQSVAPTTPAADVPPPPPLPFSLREPILSSASASSTTSPRPSAPAPSPSSLSSYLLSLLDSPAYSNLLPSYLSQHFNPRTPDDPSVRYFSVAGRVSKLGIWHPLWLPKLVLDASEKLHLRHSPPASASASSSSSGGGGKGWEMGNDGLVTIESAKWGEFLGTVEQADHWDIRGSAGFLSSHAPKPPSSSSSSVAAAAVAAEGAGPREKKEGWSWQDVNSLVGKLLTLGWTKPSSPNSSPQSPLSPDHKPAPSSSPSPSSSSSSRGNGSVEEEVAKREVEVRSISAERPDLRDLAQWISDHVPPTTPPASGSSSSPAHTPPTGEPPRSNQRATDEARLIFGASPATSTSSRAQSPPDAKVQATAKRDKFDITLFYAAVVRNLWEAGF